MRNFDIQQLMRAGCVLQILMMLFGFIGLFSCVLLFLIVR